MAFTINNQKGEEESAPSQVPSSYLSSSPPPLILTKGDLGSLI